MAQLSRLSEPVPGALTRVPRMSRKCGAPSIPPEGTREKEEPDAIMVIAIAVNVL
jgi:hypothetical protein